MTSWHLVLHLLIRWLDFLGLALLLGGVAFHEVVWRGGGAGPEAAWHGRGQRLLRWVLALVSLMTVVDLGFRARMMNSSMPLDALLPVVVIRTHVGHVWLFRLGLLAVLWLLLGRRDPKGRPARVGAAAAALGLGLAVALSGHAADRGNITLAVLADWLHVMATTVWAGGLLWLRFLLPRLDARLAAGTLRRFSRVAAISVGVLVATGLATAFQQVAAPSALVTTSYGRTLALKIVLVSAMVGLGGLARFYLLPALTGRHTVLSRAVTRVVEAAAGRVQSAAVLRRGRLLIGIEAAIGLAVLLCAAVLTQTPPPRSAMMPPPHMH